MSYMPFSYWKKCYPIFNYSIKNFKKELDLWKSKDVEQFLQPLFQSLHELKFTYSLIDENEDKHEWRNKLEEQMEDIENKILNLCEFLFTFKTKCFKNLLCKSKAPIFLKEDKIQSKINMLNLKSIPIVPTVNESNSKLKILAEITDIYLTISKTHNKELSKNYTELILVLNIKKSMLSATNSNLNKNNINTTSIVSNKLDDINKSDNFNIIYTIFAALNNIKSVYGYHLNKIINKLYSGNKLVIHKKIKRIVQNIKNVNDWLCVICILLHSIPDIETKIKDGLLSDYLNIITMQRALHKYYGGIVNNDNLYILITILFNPPKINII